MALSRIWSAFIIVAVLVAAYKWIFTGDETIFNRMVVGKADDAADSIGYVIIRRAPEIGLIFPGNAFVKNLGTYNYALKDSVQKAKVLIADNIRQRQRFSIEVLESLRSKFTLSVLSKQADKESRWYHRNLQIRCYYLYRAHRHTCLVHGFFDILLKKPAVSVFFQES